MTREKAVMVQLGYCIIYVSQVAQSLAFFEKSFGFQRRFLHEGGDYGELETGTTVLAMASHDLGARNLPDGYLHADKSDRPLGFELALVDSDVAGMHQNAIDNGAVEITAPKTKPWGQVVSYVRTPCGILLELCSPM